jgi:hypothetical protein
MRALFFAVIFLFSSVKAEDLKDINLEFSMKIKVIYYSTF